MTFGSLSASDAPNLDTRKFRNALGLFATGVAVVTTRDATDQPYGMTVNSFAAVSLEPPLVLWSLSKTNPNAAIFLEKGYFAVNVLSVGQIEISKRFARHSADKFAGIAVQSGFSGNPLLEDAAAFFECSVHDVINAGDHHVILGRVLRFDYRDVPTLVFCQGRYQRSQYLGPPLDPALETALVWGWHEL